MVVVVVAVDRGNMLAGRTADVFSVFFFLPNKILSETWDCATGMCVAACRFVESQM